MTTTTVTQPNASELLDKAADAALTLAEERL